MRGAICVMIEENMDWLIVVLCVLLLGACGVIFVLWSRLRFVRERECSLIVGNVIWR